MSKMQKSGTSSILISPTCRCEEHSSEAISLKGIGLLRSQLQCRVVNQANVNMDGKKIWVIWTFVSN